MKLKKQGYLIGLISNGPSDFQRTNLDALGIAHYFDHILISEDIGIKKPDPLIFNYFLDKCTLDAHATVYIGDHPVNDVYGAQQVGMNVIWKRNGSALHPPCTDWIDDWHELGTLLQNGLIEKEFLPCQNDNTKSALTRNTISRRFNG